VQAIALGGEHLDELPAAPDQGEQVGMRVIGEGTGFGLHTRPELGQDVGIDLVVLASCPSARAKSRTWRGLTTATARPARLKRLATAVS
jgi:hypothetical protein